MLERLLRLLGSTNYASRDTRGDAYASAVDVDVASDEPPDWIRVLQAGEYTSHPDGAHTVTREHLQEMVDRFEELSTDLLVDVDHASVFEGETRAAGWSTELELRDDGLYARWPQWTPFGQQLVDDREYRYLSPVYKLESQRKNGSQGGAVLHSIALTNTPYLDEGETSHVSAEHTPTSDPDAPPAMNREDLIQALGLSDDATDADIVEALEGAMQAFMSGEEGEDGSEGDEDGNRASSARPGNADADADPDNDESGAESDADIGTLVSSAVQRELQKRDQDRAAETLVNQAINDAKIEPAERDIYLHSARQDFDKTKKRLDALEKGRVLDEKMKTSSRSSRMQPQGQSKAADYVRSQLA